MAKERKRIRVFLVILFFILYFIAASRPIPPETVLVPRWLSALNKEPSPGAAGAQGLIPFTLGGRFGYVDTEGNFLLNLEKTGNICLSDKLWTEYEAEPANIEIRDNSAAAVLNIENPGGYPILLDNRIFILGSEQNSLSEIDSNGGVRWTYEFAAPLTCIDAAAGLVLTGSIDGVIEVLNGQGKRIFIFEPGGSRYAVILGCAISNDGLCLGIVSGIDEQRFLLLEHYGSGEYRVIYHEFLKTGFRRPVYVSFFDQDRWVVFEREGGIGFYEIKSRQGRHIALDGEIAAIDYSGGQGYFFAICAPSDALSRTRKELIGIKLPDTLAIRAPFKSEDAFLGRTGSGLIVGGGATLASFDLERR